MEQYGHVIARAYCKADPEYPEDETSWQLYIRKDLGYASVDCIYEEGILRGIKYKDEEENYTVPNGLEYAIYKCEYDSKWQLSKESYYGVDEEPVGCGKRGVAIIEYSYDYLGNVSDTIYYDKMGNVLRDPLP